MRWPEGLSLAPERSVFDKVAREAGADDPKDRPDRTQSPELAHLERVVTFASGPTSAWDLHQRLRPVLQSLARHRLRIGRGLDLDASADADAIREQLGPDLHDLVRSDRPAPTDRRGPGITLGELAAHVSRLEEM